METATTARAIDHASAPSWLRKAGVPPGLLSLACAYSPEPPRFFLSLDRWSGGLVERPESLQTLLTLVPLRYGVNMHASRIEPRAEKSMKRASIMLLPGSLQVAPSLPNPRFARLGALGMGGSDTRETRAIDS
jgi:hypothetical protein